MPRQQGGIPVRHGAAVAWARSVGEAADLMAVVTKRAAAPVALLPAAPGEVPLPVLGGAARDVLGAAAELVAVVGGSTLAKGWQQRRDAGVRPPSDLERECRILDGASALIRHPGAAHDVLCRLKAWLATAEATLGVQNGIEEVSTEGSVGSDLGPELDNDKQSFIMCDTLHEEKLQNKYVDEDSVFGATSRHTPLQEDACHIMCNKDDIMKADIHTTKILSERGANSDSTLEAADDVALSEEE
ncbi:unnamed protein product, partial [Prorocentrum cordatum]